MKTATAAGVKDCIKAELDDLIEIRHDLHAHPELMWQEERTSSVVQRELTKLGIEFKAGLAGGTGVVGHLPATTGDTSKPAVALRADMDALPITEETGLSYSSTRDGLMHACGHDGHTTILLGAARVLAQTEHRPNPVTFVFQPAEEGGGGGQRFCMEGMLDGSGADGKGGGLGPRVGSIYGLHGWPNQKLGTVKTRPGPLMASTDEFLITVRGKGGHAAWPHLTNDPVVAACAIVTSMQTIVSRSTSPVDSAVCTIGRIAGGTVDNVIPEAVEIEGTTRALTPEMRKLAEERVREISLHVAKAHGCTIDIHWNVGYPVVKNDPKMVERFVPLAEQVLGKENVLHAETPVMGGEDFAYYAEHVPACFYFLGLCPEGQEHFPELHTPRFDFNDKAIPVGVEMMTRVALDEG
ncbi:MAG: M20 family metallopeptidase [Phycisphaerales bacterium JB061]